MSSSLGPSQHKSLRHAGILYLIMAFTAPPGLVYVPGKIMVIGNASATAENLRHSGSLLHLGIASELFHQVIAVFLVMALYRLFKSVNENQARLLVILGALVSVPIMFLNVLNEIAAYILVSGNAFISAFDKNQLDSLSYLFYRIHGHGIDIASVFWGLWLFPFGTLVIQSGFIPRLFGILLYIAGSAYLAAAIATLILPSIAQPVGQVAMILEIAEVPIIFWMFIRGVRPYKTDINSSSSSL